MEGHLMQKLLASFVALLVTAPLVASAQTTRPADTRDAKAPAWKQGGLFETKDIIGTRIKSVDGKDLGEVDQLLIDRNGKVSYVVIGLGGVAGVGEKKVVVPWSDLKFAPVTEGKKNANTMDAAKLEKAPRYDRSARLDSAPAASPRSPVQDGDLRSPVQDSDKDGKSNRTDKAPLDPTKK
jgi:sporulation protein YlmC with PRC-barrel domain